MSAVVSISTRRAYGMARVCRVWGVARSGVYRLRRAAAVPPAPRRRPGPQGPMPDAALVEAAQWVLTESPFHGEGHRKVWARLRHRGLRTSKERVRRVRREIRPLDGFPILLTARERPVGGEPGGPSPRPAQP